MVRRGDEPWVQLATRIPKPLHQALKVHCVTTDISLMDFVVDAIEAKLRKQGSRSGRRRVTG
jgi:predicted HicB family RNase H-like nuclease